MTRDLSVLSCGLIGILSDAHGNGPAFDQAILVLKRLGAKKFIFLGDAVGYLPSLSVLKSLSELGSQVLFCVRGNHEEMLLSCDGSEPRDDVYQLAAVAANLGRDELAMLSKWYTKKTIQFDVHLALFVHGSPIDPTFGYVYPDTDLSIFTTEEDVVFMGHSHYPFIREHAGVRYVNVGSCGLPRDDGRFGSAALYDPAAGTVRIVRFDITAATAAAISGSGPVHSSVHKVFARQKTSIFGDFV